MSRKTKKDKDSPAARRAFVAFFHAAYWLLYLLLLLVIFSIAQAQIRKTAFDPRALLPLFALCAAPNLVSFYAFYTFLFRKFLARRKIFALLVGGALVCLCATLFGASLALAFFGFAQPIFADAREFFFLAASLFLIAAIHGAIGLVIRGFLNWHAEIKLKDELRQKNFGIETALVKSQLDPHFLFNTLNNIDVLIAKDAPRASDYLNKLSAILRYAVYETKAEKIALAKEIDHLEKYLELQRIRTTNADYINFAVTGEAGARTIAPMIFFPFVENAFKHTENNKSFRAVRVEIAIELDKIVFECENSYKISPLQKQDCGGSGNALARQRLELLYPEKHALEIADSGALYRVRLTLL